jgi:hypothetical protein
MALLSKLQKHLDDRLIRSTAVQHGKTLSLRGTFKQRDGSSKRMRVSLDLPAEDDQLIHAESRSSEFWAEYQRLGYLPDPMPWVVKVTPLPFTKTLTVNSAISQLEADFSEASKVMLSREEVGLVLLMFFSISSLLAMPQSLLIYWSPLLNSAVILRHGAVKMPASSSNVWQSWLA